MIRAWSPLENAQQLDSSFTLALNGALQNSLIYFLYAVQNTSRDKDVW